MPIVGEELAGYSLRRVVGQGGMSVVYEAEHPRLGSTVAVKVLASELAADDRFRDRFLRESQVVASLSHPNVIDIYDCGQVDDLLFIAMRYVAGPDLQALLREHPRLSVERTLLLIRQAARGLDAAHRAGVIHRDVKPANLLIEHADGEPDHVYLADFGLSKHALSRRGSVEEIAGTVDYIAPEEIKGEAVDARTDLYSLACVMYQCLTGSVPFPRDLDAAVIWAHVEQQADPPSSLNPALPRALDDVLARALAKEPADRYATCRELVEAADAALTEPAAVRRPDRTSARVGSDPDAEVPGGWLQAGPQRSAWPAPEPRDRRLGSRTLLAAIGAVVAACVIAAVVLLLSSNGSTSGGSSSGSRVADTGAGAPSHSSTMSHGSGMSKGSGMSHGSSMSQTTSSHTSTMPHNAILAAITQLDEHSTLAKGLLPPSTCKAMSASMVRCTHPHYAVTAAQFQTFPSLKRLYAGYTARVRQLNGGRFRSNFNNCITSKPYGERSWNHEMQHPLNYSVKQMASGHVSEDDAAGRFFCGFDDGDYVLVWTQNAGHLLAELSGDPHADAWNWWQRVHHEIGLGGAMPMKMTGG